MDLSIIIINWKSSQYLRECLQSIYLNTKGLSFEIIVLDNASFDGCGEMLACEYPSVTFIQGEQNLGFARGNNLAATYARGDVLLFLNPDTEIVGPALATLFDALNSMPDAGVVGARLLNSDGSIQTSCVQRYPTIPNLLVDAEVLRAAIPNARIWGMTPALAAAVTPRIVEGISGACLMTPRKVFLEVGGFWDGYFMYYEDMDYCLKVSRAGMKNYFIPGAVVTHHGGKSSGHNKFQAVMMAESAWRFFLKRRGPRYACLFRAGLAGKALSRCALLAVLALMKQKNLQIKVSSALRKWKYVFRWSLGAERWVIAYPETRLLI